MSSIEWFSAQSLAGLAGMSSAVQVINRKALRENWQSRPRQGKGGGKEYHISSLPPETQRALRISQTKKQQAESNQVATINHATLRGKMSAMSIEGDQKQEALQRTRALNQLNPKEQARVHARTEVLASWEVYIKDFEVVEAATREFVAAYNQNQLDISGSVKTFVPKVSRATLMRWKRAYAEQGPAGLAAGYKAVKVSIMDSQPELVSFAEGVLAKMPHTTAVNMLRAMEGEFDLNPDITLPSKRSLISWIAKWKVDNKRLFTAVANPDAFKNKYMVAGGDAAEGVVRLNQLWEMDSSPADIMCTDGRFTLIACLDVYSRRAVIKVRKSSDSFGVVLTARQAMLDWGLDGQGEQVIRVDNGSDYASHYFRIVADTLGIDLKNTDPYAGEQKPFVERLFRTFSHGLLELLEGYIGHNVAERQAIEAQFSFADRLKRKAGSSKNVINVSLSSEDLQTFVDNWLHTFYMHESHSGLNGKTPTQVVQDWLEPLRRIEDERALDLLLEPIPGNKGERIIQKKGVKLDGGWYVAAEMGSRVGDQVMVRYDTADIGRIYLFEMSGDFICVAENPRITGISRAELAKAMKEEQKVVAAQKAELKKKGRKIDQGELVEKIFARRERLIAEQNANVTQLPRRSHDHHTDYLEGARDALAAADQAAEQRAKEENPSPEMQAAMASFITENKASAVQANKQAKKETPTSRFRRWHQLDQRVKAGETLSEFEQRWKTGHETTAEWQGHMLIFEEFGIEAFGRD